MSTQLAPIVIIVFTIKPVRRWAVVTFWDLNGCYLEVVLGLARRMRAKEEPMGGVRFIRRPRLV